MRITKSDASVVGWFFHERNRKGEIGWQGRIIAEDSPGLYLFGNSSQRRFVRRGQMRYWTFYPDAGTMKREFEVYERSELEEGEAG
jgi:hypothetical protein